MCDEDFFRDARAAADGEQAQSDVSTPDIVREWLIDD